MYLFELASRHMTWLAERQALTAANIANADTPGYRARDVRPFSTALEGPAVTFITTMPGHIRLAPGEMRESGRASGLGSAAAGMAMLAFGYRASLFSPDLATRFFAWSMTWLTDMVAMC